MSITSGACIYFILIGIVYGHFEISIPLANGHTVSTASNGHGVALYSNQVYMINGALSIEYSHTTSVHLNESWINTSVTMPFAFMETIAYYGQTNAQIGNKMYGVPFYRTSSNAWFEGPYLLSFDLDINAYNDPSTYNHSLPQMAGWSCLAAANDRLYVIGGVQTINSVYHYLDYLQIYDVTLDVWSFGSNLNIGRFYSGCAVTASSNLIYSFAGMMAGYSQSKVIERYDIALDKWTLLNTEMNAVHHKLSCIAVDNPMIPEMIWCIGGYGEIKSMEQFLVINEQILPYDASFDMNNGLMTPKLLITDNNWLLVVGGDGFPEYYIERFDLNSLTNDPTTNPTLEPTTNPTIDPTIDPTVDPTKDPTFDPTKDPTADPTVDPTNDPTTFEPTFDPTSDPTNDPTKDPTADPTFEPTFDPTKDPTKDPTSDPTDDPTSDPTFEPTSVPTSDPTNDPTLDPTTDATVEPTIDPTLEPTINPTSNSILVSIDSEEKKDKESKDNILDTSKVWIWIIVFGVIILIVLILLFFCKWRNNKQRTDRAMESQTSVQMTKDSTNDGEHKQEVTMELATQIEQIINIQTLEDEELL